MPCCMFLLRLNWLIFNDQLEIKIIIFILTDEIIRIRILLRFRTKNKNNNRNTNNETNVYRFLSLHKWWSDSLPDIVVEITKWNNPTEKKSGEWNGWREIFIFTSKSFSCIRFLRYLARGKHCSDESVQLSFFMYHACNWDISLQYNTLLMV